MELKFLNRIITVDETSLLYYDLEDKHLSGKPLPKKLKVMESILKHIYFVFISCHGVLLCHVILKGETVYVATTQR